jgi:hypothetical protein
MILAMDIQSSIFHAVGSSKSNGWFGSLVPIPAFFVPTRARFDLLLPDLFQIERVPLASLGLANADPKKTSHLALQ